MLHSLAQLVLRLPHCIPLSIGPTTDGFRIYETSESASDCPKMSYHKAGDTIENVNHETFLHTGDSPCCGYIRKHSGPAFRSPSECAKESWRAEGWTVVALFESKRVSCVMCQKYLQPALRVPYYKYALNFLHLACFSTSHLISSSVYTIFSSHWISFSFTLTLPC